MTTVTEVVRQIRADAEAAHVVGDDVTGDWLEAFAAVVLSAPASLNQLTYATHDGTVREFAGIVRDTS